MQEEQKEQEAAAAAVTEDEDEIEPEDEAWRLKITLVSLTGDDTSKRKGEFLLCLACTPDDRDGADLWQQNGMMMSPVTGEGVNYDKKWFDRAYLFVGRNSTSDLQVWQQLNRVRRLEENRVYVHVEGKDIPHSEKCDAKAVKNEYK